MKFDFGFIWKRAIFFHCFYFITTWFFVYNKISIKVNLERALRRRNIPYCTLETPCADEEFETRAKTLILIVSDLIQ